MFTKTHFYIFFFLLTEVGVCSFEKKEKRGKEKKKEKSACCVGCGHHFFFLREKEGKKKVETYFFLKDGDCRLTSVGENVAAILFNLQVTEGNLEKKNPKKTYKKKKS